MNREEDRKFKKSGMKLLSWVLCRAREVEKHLRRSMKPTYPFEESRFGVECSGLGPMLLAVGAEDDPWTSLADGDNRKLLDPFLLYGLSRDEMANFLVWIDAVYPDFRPSVRWLLRLREVTQETVSDETRPSLKLVADWESAAGLLDQVLTQAVAELDAEEQKTKDGHAEPGEGGKKKTEGKPRRRKGSGKGGRRPLSQSEIDQRCELWEEWTGREEISRSDFLDDYNLKHGKNYTVTYLKNARRTHSRERNGV